MNIKESVRNSTAAEIFSLMASKEKSNAAINKARSMSDTELELMGKLSNMPDSRIAASSITRLPLYIDLV